MAVNRRPSGWFYDGNPDYKGTTVAERRAIQNQIDIEDQLIENNRLLQEKARQEAQNTDKLARAIKAASDNKFYGLLQIGLASQRTEELNRKIRLCDKLGMCYEDIIAFYSSLNFITDPKAQEIMEQLKNIKKVVAETTPEIEDRQEALNDNIKEVEDLKQEIQQLEHTINNQGFFKKLFDTTTEQELAKKKAELAQCEQDVKEIRQELKEQKTILNKAARTSKIQEYEKQIQEVEAEYNKKIEAFNRFRETHYCDEFEMLFRQLGLDIGIVEPKTEGTIKDYNRYILSSIKK